jgi:hypothetical protein
VVPLALDLRQIPSLFILFISTSTGGDQFLRQRLASILGGLPSFSASLAAISFVHLMDEGSDNMKDEHSVFDAMGAMSLLLLLVAVGSVAALLFP